MEKARRFIFHSAKSVTFDAIHARSDQYQGLTRTSARSSDALFRYCEDSAMSKINLYVMGRRTATRRKIMNVR